MHNNIKLIINEYPNNLSFDLLGFDPTVCLSLTQETALHRGILYLHYSKITRLSYKTKIMIHLLKDCLHLQDEALQTLLHTAAIKLGSGNMGDYVILHKGKHKGKHDLQIQEPA